MPNRRKGAPGSFGAPLEKIVAGFPAESARHRNTSEEQTASREPRLSKNDLGESIRKAFILNDVLRDRG